MSQVGRDEKKTILNIQKKGLTYLSIKKLVAMTKVLKALEDSALPGCIIEAGCARGGSTVLISSLKKTDRPFFAYDGMIPAPTADDDKPVHERYQTILKGEAVGIEVNCTTDMRRTFTRA